MDWYFLGCGLGLGFGEHPLSFLEAHELVNAQDATFGLEQIARSERFGGFLEGEERRVRRRRFDRISRFVVARLASRGAAEVGSLTKRLMQMILQTMNAVAGHGSCPIIAQNNSEEQCCGG